MREETKKALEHLSNREEKNLVAKTVRIPKDLNEQIERLCGDNPTIRLSVLLRQCIHLGWIEVNK